MLRTLFSFVFCCCLITAAQSQTVRRFQQTHLMREASTTLQIDAIGEVEVVNWAGSDILVEVTVTTSTGSVAILNQLQKEGRYDLALAVDNGQALLSATMPKRQPVKIKGAQMDEHVKYRISIPTAFAAANSSVSNAFTRSEK